jgi:anti-sigma factor RsiW
MSVGCEQVLERLSPFLDREVSDVEAAEIARHLAACPPCGVSHRRLGKLEALSVLILRGAPAVGAAEWGARWSRVGPLGAASPRAIAVRARRARSMRRVFVRFALAASLLVAATLLVPLLHARLHEVVHPAGHLCYKDEPGANESEILEEPYTETDTHWVEVESADPVVIAIQKL